VPLRVGIIGAGAMGSTHARLLRDEVAGAEVVAVADADAGRARAVAEVCGGRVIADGLDLVADPGVDAVLVASPGDTHAAYVRACLAAGRPVLCEKPLAATADAARRVVDAEAAGGRRLVQVGFMRRFDPGYVALREALDAGGVGAPVVVHSIHRNRSVPPGFGTELILKDTLVHDVDVVRFLLGQEVVRATVHAGRPSALAPDGVQDPVVVVLATDAGVVATVEAFVNARYAYDIRCEVVGETGTVELPAPPHPAAGFEDRFAAAYTAELRAWVAAVGSGIPAGASVWDGYAGAAVCEAASASLRSGGPVDVVLGPVPDLYRELAPPER
jgi:myo-inositol 2-dehydrogenase / D-chiro-inositol 1-dehydrogenase